MIKILRFIIKLITRLFKVIIIILLWLIACTIVPFIICYLATGKLGISEFVELTDRIGDE